MTTGTVVGVLGIASTVAFCVIAALTVRDWLATKDTSRMYLALAIGCLGAVSILGQAAKLLGTWFAGANAVLGITIFLGSGLALLLFRDSVIPLARRTRRLVIFAVLATAVLEIGVALGRTSTPKALQTLGLFAFVAVWCGCVGEPSVRLWVASRRRTAVQRARMRALSLGYIGIIAILLSAILASSFGPNPAVRIAIALSSLAIVPFLYAGFVPPVWLRRAWRESEETKFRQATHDILLFASDRATLANRALDWAVRLSGADAGLFRSEGTTIATLGMTTEEAAVLESTVSAAAGRHVVPLGGRPPRTAIIAPLAEADAAIILVGGPFTPVFGTDEQAWLQHYAALVSTGLDRVRLVGELETKVNEVTERTRQLEAANDELGAFSYSVSHDLRAPLRAVNGYTSILLEEFSSGISEEGLGFLKRIKENGDHMGHLVEVGAKQGESDRTPVYFVKDNGAGFDMQYASKLFGVFQRLHRNQDFEGTGVGLAIVQRIVNRHGGRVWAEGKVNEGATFYFTLSPGGAQWQQSMAA